MSATPLLAIAFPRCLHIQLKLMTRCLPTPGQNVHLCVVPTMAAPQTPTSKRHTLDVVVQEACVHNDSQWGKNKWQCKRGIIG